MNHIRLLLCVGLMAISVNPLKALSQNLNIEVSPPHFQIDESRALILSHIDNIEAYTDLSVYSSVSIELANETYEFSNMPQALSYTQSYGITKGGIHYTLYFTPLPIIAITSDNEIPDKPKVLAYFTYADTDKTFASPMGIELRGGTALAFPKKTYDIELWTDESGEETQKVSFGKLRKDDDWILDALYNEPLRLRSYISNKLWLNMHTLYYQEDEPKAKAGSDVMFVEVFLKGHYNGVYNLQEQMDKKQLKIKSYAEEIKGELYKGSEWGDATMMHSAPTYDNTNRFWGGYTMKYPKADKLTNWENLYQFVYFVVNARDEDFKANIWSQFNYENYLDYFIFLNLLHAIDNTGKNTYLAKYKQDTPYFYVPWDLDAVFGMNWDGTYLNQTDGILSNGLHNRVIALNVDDYGEFIKNKWLMYRTQVLSSDSLKNVFSSTFHYLYDNKVYEREALVYDNYPYGQEALSYIHTWLDGRLSFLDNYFNHPVSVEEFAYAEEISIYPNPAKEKIYIARHRRFLGAPYQIYDIAGHVVKQGLIDNKHIDISALPSGHYVLYFDNSGHKLIIY